MADSPVTVIKSAFSPGKLIAGAIAFIAIALVFDVAGITNWLLFPFSTAKAYFSKVTTPAAS